MIQLKLPDSTRTATWPDGPLRLELRPEEREELQELWDDAEKSLPQKEAEVLESVLCNSELQWVNDGEGPADLTGAPRIGIALADVEDNAFVFRWAFMDYAVRSFIEDLLERGFCVWQGGRVMSETDVTSARCKAHRYMTDYAGRQINSKHCAHVAQSLNTLLERAQWTMECTADDEASEACKLDKEFADAVLDICAHLENELDLIKIPNEDKQ